MLPAKQDYNGSRKCNSSGEKQPTGEVFKQRQQAEQPHLCVSPGAFVEGAHSSLRCRGQSNVPGLPQSRDAQAQKSDQFPGKGEAVCVYCKGPLQKAGSCTRRTLQSRGKKDLHEGGGGWYNPTGSALGRRVQLLQQLSHSAPVQCPSTGESKLSSSYLFLFGVQLETLR